jgi:cytochrome P450 family 110
MTSVAMQPLPKQHRSSLGCAWQMAKNPEAFFRECLEQQGETFLVSFPGIGPILFSGSPQGAEAMFRSPPELFEPLTPNPVEPLLGIRSLILLSGQRHQRERKLMMPSFHGEHIKSYGEVIQQRVLSELRLLRVGVGCDLQRLCRNITLGVIIQVVFGIHNQDRYQVFQQKLSLLLDSYTPSLTVMPALRRSFGGVGPWSRFERAKRNVDQLLREEIRNRRSQPTESKDIFSLLLQAEYEDGGGLTDDDLVDELCTLLVAGHETTATALVWATFFVHQHTRIREQLLEELNTNNPETIPSVYPSLSYLSATCQEALRLHPVVPLVVRKLRSDMVFCGVQRHAGDVIALAIPLLHQRKESFPFPDSFDPRNFIDRKPTPFEYAPFGGGARRCLGAAFALYEMKVILGTLMAFAHFAPSFQEVPTPMLQNITMAPTKKIELQLLGFRKDLSL